MKQAFRHKWQRRAARWIPPSLLQRWAGPVALFFHGVEHRLENESLQRNHMPVEDFYAIARQLKIQSDVLPLDALPHALAHPEKHRRAVFLMADDGYANTYSLAQDILADLRMPWTLFVSTHHIDTADPNPFFVARLFAYFAAPGPYRLPHFDGAIELRDAKQREMAAERIVGTLKSLAAGPANAALSFMTATIGTEQLAGLIAKFPSEKFLTWREVKELHRRGVEIGAHAHWHWPLNGAQTPETVAEEVLMSRDRIVAEIGSCRYFAYPFGNRADISRRAWREVRNAGFDYAFTTLSGTLDASRNRWLMPRYGLQKDDRDFASLLPLLHLGNRRLTKWQERLAH